MVLTISNTITLVNHLGAAQFSTVPSKCLAIGQNYQFFVEIIGVPYTLFSEKLEGINGMSHQYKLRMPSSLLLVQKTFSVHDNH